ncbi:helix-turn-helix domain-containing protein (plasmid) [Sphaerotilaceae bacterium SBD11-9]
MTTIPGELDDSSSEQPQFALGAYYARTLFDRHGVASRERSRLVERVLGIAYSAAHRRVKGSAPLTFEELNILAAHFGETLADVFSAAASADAKTATFLSGSLAVRCKVWLGDEEPNPKRGDLIAAMEHGELVVTHAGKQTPRPVYSVRQVLLTTHSPKRVAVLDDDADITDSVCDYLRRSGFIAEPYYNLADLAASARKRPFDAYVLDWLLGETNVSELIAELRAGPGGADKPIAVLTGQAESEPGIASDIADALATHKVLFFQKPITSAVIAQTLARLMAGKQKA